MTPIRELIVRVREAEKSDPEWTIRRHWLEALFVYFGYAVASVRMYPASSMLSLLARDGQSVGVESNVVGQTEKRAEFQFWWRLLALVLRSIRDYYAWTGPMGGFQRLLIGLFLKR